MLLILPPALVQGPGQMPPPPRPGGHHPDMPLLRVVPQLGLSDDQLVRIHEALQAHRDAVEQKALALHQAQRAVHEAVNLPGAASGRIESLARAASERELDLLKEIAAANAAAWGVLDPAQRDKAKALLSRMPLDGPEMERGRGPGRGPGMGPGGPRDRGDQGGRQGGPEALPPGPPQED